MLWFKILNIMVMNNRCEWTRSFGKQVSKKTIELIKTCINSISISKLIKILNKLLFRARKAHLEKNFDVKS